MPQLPIGLTKAELDTPVLCLDLDALESNIAVMARTCHDKGVAWRPHQKCGKTPVIARQEIAAGALGVTCAKVSEAEVLAAGGVHDILIANMIVGDKKVERVAALRRWCDPIIACDHFAQVEPLAARCRQRGVTVRMMVEVNIGLDRVGTAPGRDTLELAQAIDRLEGVKLIGIMGYEGHLLQIAEPDKKQAAIRESLGTLVGCRDLLLRSGLCCDIVSCGGTGSFQMSVDVPGITEVQAGGGIFMDRMYSEKCRVTGLRYALTVLSTVVSRPVRAKAVLDAGRKTFNGDFGVPVLKGYPDAEVVRMSAEHCEVVLGPESERLKIGDRVEIIIGYSDFTTVLHDEFYGFRGDRLEVVWPIQGRGMLQ